MENWGETMPKRTTCVPAMFAILFVALTLGAASAEPARDDCVANPNAAVPRGSHWYYRVDRTANRRCWFLAPEGLKVRQAESPKRLPSTNPTSQLNSEPRAEAASSESAARVLTSPPLSNDPNDSEPSPTEHTTAENASSNFGTAAELSIDAAEAEQPPKVPPRGRAAAPAEDASMSMWQWIAGAGVLMFITAILLIMCRSISSFGARAQRGTKTIQRRNALSPALVSNVRGRSARSFNPGPIARPRAFSPAREALNPAQPTHDLEKDLSWLLERSRRKAA